MKGYLRYISLVCILACTGVDAGAAFSGQDGFTTVVVNGRALIGPSSTARRQNGIVVLPIAAIGRALGDSVSLSSPDQVTVRRLTGASADLDLKSGRLNENGLLNMVLAGTSAIALAANVNELYLPVEVSAALLDASISLDTNKNAVVVSRGAGFSRAAQSAAKRGPIDLQRVDYEYGVNRYSTSLAQSLTLNAVGRLGDGRFALTSNSTRTASSGIDIRYTSFMLERPNGHRYSLGDMGAGGELQFMSTNVRGLGVIVPFGGFNVTAFGGRTFSGGSIDIIEEIPKPLASHRYDTTVAGSYLTTATRHARVGAGAMMFSGPGRRGTFASSNVAYSNRDMSVQADTAIGNFDGVRYDGTRVDGAGFAVDVTGTYRLSDDLTLQGRYTRVGRNFLSPRPGVREPLDLKAAGFAWSPTKWLSTSVNASWASRPGDSRNDNKFISTSFAITPSPSGPRLYVSHTQSRSSVLGSGAFTLINASKDFARMRLYLNTTRVQNVGPASLNAQLGGTYTLNDSHSFEISQSLGTGRSLNGQFDWRTSGFLNRRLSFAAGVGYSDGRTSRIAAYERLSASLKLPRQSSLQISYFHANGSSVLVASLKGTVFAKRESRAFLDSPVSTMNEYGSVSGRVYQDVDTNGRFDDGVDKPLADVSVRVDGNRYVVSDAQGLYSFTSVTAGDHNVYLDLLSVRADLTLLGAAGRDTSLAAGGSLTQDFRLARTGRITGRIWLDGNRNGKIDDGEIPLADIRVATSSGIDTLSDADGYFTLTDLPPGEHIIALDPKSIPEKTEAGTKPLAVHSFAGRETTDVNLTVVPVAAEVKRFPARAN